MKLLAFVLFFLSIQTFAPETLMADFDQQVRRPENSIRIATFNASLNRRAKGQLIKDFTSGENRQGQKIAEIIQIVRPDILLINEFDYDEDRASAKSFVSNYLGVGQGKSNAIAFPYVFSKEVNTGIPSGLDLDKNGKDNGPGDAFGFGYFPGQYGMLVLSRFPIQLEKVRTFQRLRWKEMPNALLPITDGTDFYADAALEKFRLSSKSHWDVPIQVQNRRIHFLVFHPTPPVFDGPEDRNGKRNHDEIRLWADYLGKSKASYIVDDNGRKGGLTPDASFVIAGDANADPHDGDSTDDAILQLLNHERVNSTFAPSSPGGIEQSKKQGGKNASHNGDPAHDTADFGDVGRASGNLRIDYALPSKDLKVVNSGVFWPPSDHPYFELVAASDHRLVWIDVDLGGQH